MSPRDVRARAALVAAIATAADTPTGTRPVEVIAYTGGIVDVGNGPEVFDLAGLELDDVPLLVDHDETRVAGYSVDAVVVPWRDPAGAADAPELPALRLLGRLLVDEDEPEGRRVANRLDKKFPQQASVRISVLEEELVPEGETREINGRTLVGPFIHDKRSTLRETSFVSLGADKNTRAVALAAKKKEQPMPAPEQAPETKKKNEDEENETPVAEAAATAEQLDAAFPDHPRFAMDQLKAGATLSAAQGAFNKVIAAELKTERAARAKLEADRKAGKPSPTLVPALRPADDSGEGEEAPAAGGATAIETFRGKVREACASGLSREQATSKVARENPGLHRQVLAQANPGLPARK